MSFIAHRCGGTWILEQQLCRSHCNFSLSFSTFKQQQSVSDTIIAGGAATVAAVAGIFATKQDGDAQSKAVEEEEELPKIDVSIPYNAAAKLAFDSYSAEASSKSFAKFEAMYLEKAVEEVKFKQWKKSVAAEEAAKEANLNSLQSKMDDFMKA